ncbi:MAG: DUF1679 domain-containing protein [Alphaproteobacteria bacterium]|nr:DUF1679 domain-containing protein [Alphaproteobacteria bacterium]
MTGTVLKRPEDVTPGWLTEVLRRRPGLAGVRVASVSVSEPPPRIVSVVARLGIAYGGEPPRGAPRRLILKMTSETWKSASGWTPGLGEVTFYRDIAPAMTDPPVPRCYDAAFEPETRRFHLLLEDLSDSHRESGDWPLPPTTAECEHIMETFARLHASMWGDPRLGNDIGQLPNLDRIGLDVAEAFVAFADRLDDRLSGERRERCERVIAAYPRLKRRFASTRDLTLTHGDAHVWNLFYPREEGSRDIRIIDWENWRVRPAAWDLAYMMAVHWYPERRRALEDRLLRHYHRALVVQGVRDYDIAALRRDYRLAVVTHLHVPLWQARESLPAAQWWPNFERVMLALEDLDCEAALRDLA